MNLSRTSLLIAAPALALTMSACDNPRPVHDSTYYSQNLKEAGLRRELCERLGIAERSAECVNADMGAARAVYGHGSVRP